MNLSLANQFTDNLALKEKVALITGSTSGIGLATAHLLAEQGANIIIHGLVPISEGLELKQQFEDKYGVKVMFSDANIAESEQIDLMMLNIKNTFKQLDIVVNNAGIQYTETIENFPRDKWNAIIAINLSAAFHIMQQALPLMKERKWGRVINVASVHGLVGSAKKSAYVAAKHGLVGLTKVAAIEEAANGVTINAICPGWVETPLINNQIAELAKQQGTNISEAKHQLITNKQPLPAMATPEQIGNLILFLCTDTARSITGASLPIDGAWTSQ
ncbi:3-hydroxybutyrate dehydrogenase [Psychrosphaera haliotis]|nr:3-hydroxybutyrate dehydrogenase [Psychrosphaera haliotis]